MAETLEKKEDLSLADRLRKCADYREKMHEAATASPWCKSRISSMLIVAQSNDQGIASCGGYSNNRMDPEKLAREQVASAGLIVATRNSLPAEIAQWREMANLLDEYRFYGKSDTVKALEATVLVLVEQIEGEMKNG